METITFDTSSLHPVGTKFITRDKAKREATVIGYHVEFDTDTQKLNVTYRIETIIVGQSVTSDVPRSTVDRAILELGRTGNGRP